MVSHSQCSAEPDKVHKQYFTVRNLTARSVTIYPTSAAIVRDIKNFEIKVGRPRAVFHTHLCVD